MSSEFDAYTIAAVGTSASVTTGALAATAIPLGADGNKVRFVRVLPTANAFIKFGITGVTATTNDILINPNQAEIFGVKGLGFFSAITTTGTVTVNVTPIEF